MAVFARTTTVRGSADAIEDGIREVRDQVMPAVQEMDGCVGLSMMVDREDGTAIVATAWDSEGSLSASRERVRSLRERAVDTMGGAKPEVQEWEIAVLHREHRAGDGAFARVTWLEVAPERIDDQLATFRSVVLPRLQELSGFCSASVMVDRQRGLGASAVTYDSREALEATREISSRLRNEATSRTGARILDIAELELVLAHLRVPETV